MINPFRMRQEKNVEEIKNDDELQSVEDVTKALRPDSPVQSLKSLLDTSINDTHNVVINDNQTEIKIDQSGVTIGNINLDNINQPASTGFTKKYTADEIDVMRKHSQSYSFLCKCVEAMEWINKFVPVNSLNEMIAELPSGVYLAKIAKACGFNCTVHEIKKSGSMSYFEVENIYSFIRFCNEIGLNKTFLFETNDLRDMKNLRQVIYCLHALALLLKRKGISDGIKKRSVELEEGEIERWDDCSDRMFDELEDKLDETLQMNSSKAPSFEDLLQNTSEQSPSADNSISTEDANVVVMKSLIETLLYNSSFKNILYGDKIHLQSLKKFIDLMPQDDPEMIESDIISQFRKNMLLKNRINEVYRNTRLILENQAVLRGVKIIKDEKINNIEDFSKILYLFMINYDAIINLISVDSSIPLDDIYPSSIVGDFHFCKIILKLLDNKQNKKAQEIAQKHFKSSEYYKMLNDLINQSELPEMNPIEIYKKTYNMTVHNDEIAFEAALGEESVRKCIVENSKEVIKYFKKFNQFLRRTEMPVYCYLFDDKYDLFIKDVVESSRNKKYAAEIGGLLFNCKKQKEYFSGVLKELVMNFSSDFNDVVFTDSNEIHEKLLENLEYSDGLKINLSYEVINTIILLLKKNKDMFKGEINRLIKNLSLFQKMKNTSNKVLFDLSDLFSDTLSTSVDSTLTTIIREVKKKMVTLIKHTKKRNVMGMLYLRGGINTDDLVYSSDGLDSDVSMFNCIQDLKRGLVNDLEFLEQQGITSRETKYSEILEMIAKDILKPENRDLELNDETAEMVEQRGDALKGNLERLENYFTALAKKMTKVGPKIQMRVDKHLIREVVDENLLNMSNLLLDVTNVGPTKFKFDIHLNGNILITDVLYLTDILRDIEDGLVAIEVGHQMKLDARDILQQINSSFIAK